MNLAQCVFKRCNAVLRKGLPASSPVGTYKRYPVRLVYEKNSFSSSGWSIINIFSELFESDAKHPDRIMNENVMILPDVISINSDLTG